MSEPKDAPQAPSPPVEDPYPVVEINPDPMIGMIIERNEAPSEMDKLARPDHTR